ncbi:hypothetical protein SCACP_07800 [Sporomusa carbonis]
MVITIEAAAKEYILRKSDEHAVSIRLVERPGGV